MPMNSDSVVKGFDVLKYKTICMIEVFNAESFKPLSLNECMEGLNAGIVPWIGFLGIA